MERDLSLSPATQAAGVFGCEVSGQLLQGLGAAWGLSVPKPTSRIPWDAKQRHWNLNQLYPESALSTHSSGLGPDFPKVGLDTLSSR